MPEKILSLWRVFFPRPAPKRDEEKSPSAERAQLAQLEADAEKAYDQMYEVHDYHSAKEWKDEACGSLIRAIALARQLGLENDAVRLDKRLEHIIAVWAHQFR